jgi:microcystin-dependent protein
MTFFKWSRTTGITNGSTDSNCPWPEGQLPSTVNDAARNMMAVLAMFRDDISGNNAATGSASAYAITSRQGFTTSALADGHLIAFQANHDNTGASTLNVSGVGVKPLRGKTGVALEAGNLVTGTPYLARYKESTGEWLLVNWLGSTPTDTSSYVQYVPIGGMVDYCATTITPSLNWKFCNGQSLAKASYTTLNSLLSAAGYPYGSDASNLFLPDFRGRVAAGLDTMGGTASQNRLTGLTEGVNGDTLGAFGGLEKNTLSLTEMPSHTHVATVNEGSGHSHTVDARTDYAVTGSTGGMFDGGGGAAQNTNLATTGISVSNASQGGSQPHNNVQPTLITTKIMRVL